MERDIYSALARLRVNTGLQGTVQRLDDEWRVGLGFDRDHRQFYLDLHYGHRRQRAFLKPEDVETSSRSQWMTERIYRLSVEGLEKAEAQVRRGIELTEAKRTQRGRT